LKRTNRIVLIVIAACLVTGGTAIGVLVFATWGELNYENNYYYKPSVPSPIEKINIITDIGAVDIKYNKTPTDFYAQIDLDIHIEGILVKGTSLTDFFYPILWQNTTTELTFTLDAKPTPGLIFGFLHQIRISLTLRTDVVYDINTLTTTGSISMKVPDNIIVNNTILGTTTGTIFLNTSKTTTFQGNVGLSATTGSVTLHARQVNFTRNLTTFTTTGSIGLNFSKCVIGGNLIGTVTTGSISFSSYNMQYTADYTWRLETTTGSVAATILQYTEMGANITGLMLTTTGGIDVLYKDNLASVGAEFTCFTTTGSNTYVPVGSGGFTESGVNPKTITSDDYDDANSKYTFDITATTGSNNIIGESL
jgi:hypothetical protein